MENKNSSNINQSPTSVDHVGDNAPIYFTEKALSQLEQLLIKKNNANLKFRMYIVGGGCSGFQYGFSFDEVKNEDDLSFENIWNGKIIPIVIDELSLQYLNGATLDYLETLQGSRFSVTNPHAETTCGCGSSFSLKEEKTS